MTDVTAQQFQTDVNDTSEWVNGDENHTQTFRLGQTADSPAKLINDINDRGNAAIDELRESRGFRVRGSFASGFTYELPNDVGTDSSGNSWVFSNSNNLPFTVPAGTTPSEPVYQQVVFEKQIIIDFVTQLAAQNTNDYIYCKNHSSGNGGVGGVYIYKSGLAKTVHDGVKFVSPTVPFTSLSNYLKGNGESDPSGLGVWECVTLSGKKPVVSFVIDDGTENQYDDIPPIFDARNLKCAFAIIPELTNDGTARMSKSEVQDLNSRGYEIIAHSRTDLRTTTSKALCDAEINTAYYRANKYAKVNGYLPSQSELSSTGVESAMQLYDYSFSGSPVQSQNDLENALFNRNEYYTLTRVNIDGSNASLGIPAAQVAAINYKNLVMYEHLFPQNTTQLPTILDEISQYSAIEIGLPRDSFEKSITEKTHS